LDLLCLQSNQQKIQSECEDRENQDEVQELREQVLRVLESRGK